MNVSFVNLPVRVAHDDGADDWFAGEAWVSPTVLLDVETVSVANDRHDDKLADEWIPL